MGWVRWGGGGVGWNSVGSAKWTCINRWTFISLFFFFFSLTQNKQKTPHFRVFVLAGGKNNISSPPQTWIHLRASGHIFADLSFRDLPPASAFAVCDSFLGNALGGHSPLSAILTRVCLRNPLPSAHRPPPPWSKSGFQVNLKKESYFDTWLCDHPPVGVAGPGGTYDPGHFLFLPVGGQGEGPHFSIFGPK